MEYTKSGNGENAKLIVASIGTATDTDLIIPAHAQFEGETLPVKGFEEAFRQNMSITSVVIPKGFTSISQAVFMECKKLVSVVFPDSLTAIDSMAFSGWVLLTSITLPDTIETIGVRVFENCSGLITFTVPENVALIESDAFDGATHLIEVYNKSSPDITAIHVSAENKSYLSMECFTIKRA